jgi:periplasmic protein TonB
MFESALELNIPRRQLGRGAVLSIVAHGVLIGLALYISSRPSTHHEKLRELTFFNPPPPPPPPPPPGGGSKAKKVEPKKIIKKPDTIVETKKEKIPEKPPDPTPETPEPGGQPGGVQGGVAGGVVGGVIGGTVGGTLGGVIGGTGNGTQVIPFGMGMERPTVVHPPDITFSKEALAMRVGGLALAECTINLDGSLSDCHLKKSLPYMDAQLLQAAHSMKFTPVIYQGHPQRVLMTIPIRVPTPN